MSNGCTITNTSITGQMWIDNTTSTIKISDGSSWNTLSLDKVNDRIVDRIEKIEQRLCILDEPNPEILEKHKALKRAYEEYKMLEKLIIGNQK